MWFYRFKFHSFLIENGLSGQIVNLDKMTYAGNKENLSFFENYDIIILLKGDICNQEIIKNITKISNIYIFILLQKAMLIVQLMGQPNSFKQM